MAAAGEVPTLETLAAIKILRQQAPDLKIRSYSHREDMPAILNWKWSD